MILYSLATLQALPTLAVAQFDDLKEDTGTERVWLSRMTPADGARASHIVTVEHLDDSGRWTTKSQFPAKR